MSENPLTTSQSQFYSFIACFRNSIFNQTEILIEDDWENEDKDEDKHELSFKTKKSGQKFDLKSMVRQKMQNSKKKMEKSEPKSEISEKANTVKMASSKSMASEVQFLSLKDNIFKIQNSKLVKTKKIIVKDEVRKIMAFPSIEMRQQALKQTYKKVDKIM